MERAGLCVTPGLELSDAQKADASVHSKSPHGHLSSLAAVIGPVASPTHQ